MFRREQVNSAQFARTTDAYRRAVNGTILYDSAISAFLEWVALAAVRLSGRARPAPCPANKRP
jgi:ATP-binding cassette subfamily B protein